MTSAYRESDAYFQLMLIPLTNRSRMSSTLYHLLLRAKSLIYLNVYNNVFKHSFITAKNVNLYLTRKKLLRFKISFTRVSWPRTAYDKLYKFIAPKHAELPVKYSQRVKNTAKKPSNEVLTTSSEILKQLIYIHSLLLLVVDRFLKSVFND